MFGTVYQKGLLSSPLFQRSVTHGILRSTPNGMAVQSTGMLKRRSHNSCYLENNLAASPMYSSSSTVFNRKISSLVYEKITDYNFERMGLVTWGAIELWGLRMIRWTFHSKPTALLQDFRVTTCCFYFRDTTTSILVLYITTPPISKYLNRVRTSRNVS